MLVVGSKMAITDSLIYITNASNSKRFYFRAVAPFKIKKIQPSIVIPMPNTSAANRFLFRLTGQGQDVSFSFVLFDDGDDVSLSDNIVTVKQQAEYLLDEIFTYEFDTLWSLVVYSEFDDPMIGVIDNIDLDTAVGGRIRTGTITFKQGRIGLL